MNQVNWFEIPVKNLERAKIFYSTVFNATLTESEMPGMKMAMFEGDMEAFGATGALVSGEGMEPSASGSTVYFYCEDVNNELQRIETNGGKIIVPKTPIGEHGFFAQFIDCEGNRVALHSTK